MPVGERLRRKGNRATSDRARVLLNCGIKFAVQTRDLTCDALFGAIAVEIAPRRHPDIREVWDGLYARGASAALRHRNRTAVGLVAAGASIGARHVPKWAGVRLAGVLVRHLRLGAITSCARRKLMDVQKRELWIRPVGIETGDRLVDARRRLTTLVASHAQGRVSVGPW